MPGRVAKFVFNLFEIWFRRKGTFSGTNLYTRAGFLIYCGENSLSDIFGCNYDYGQLIGLYWEQIAESKLKINEGAK